METTKGGLTTCLQVFRFGSVGTLSPQHANMWTLDPAAVVVSGSRHDEYYFLLILY